MTDKFKAHINENLPFLWNSRVLVAVSGGIDSIVLCHLCKVLGLDMALAHCNFNLRGAESDGDEHFVAKLAKKMGVEFFVEHFDTKAYAENQKVSIQMAARELRYEWFNSLVETLGFQYVLTAHQADDTLETFLINLSRGTGLEGLTGIPTVNGHVVRPMLPFSRNEIVAYAVGHELKWREDSSNSETKYLRNKIRHDIVPGLNTLTPGFMSNFKTTEAHLQGVSQMLENYVNELKKQWFTKEKQVWKIPVAPLTVLQPRKTYLHYLFREYGFKELADLENLLFADSGKKVYSNTHQIIRNREYLLLTALKETDTDSKIFEIHEEEKETGTPIALFFEDVHEIQSVSESVIYVDKEKLKYPLILRKWKNGDYFYPFGLNGKKKISKYFKDEKYSLLDKEAQWLLCSDNQVVWIVGKRADDRFKVENRTKQILKIALQDNI